MQLEVHQQLNTQHKLFCYCPVGLQSQPADAKIIRQVRPMFGESDLQATEPMVYELCRESTCTYEMDDTPPFPMNQQALDIVIEIAMRLNCHIVDEIHVNRKRCLDGSMPSGFQRTALVAVGGRIASPGFASGKINILQVNIQEDSCRPVAEPGATKRWKTDRLSTPLVEVIAATEEQTAEVTREEITRLIGEVLRATGKVCGEATAAPTPSAAMLYPDTDLLPMAIASARLQQIRQQVR